MKNRTPHGRECTMPWWAGHEMSPFDLASTIPNHPAIAMAVKVLNEALAADPQAVRDFIALEVPVNQELAQHPTIQVGPSFKADKDTVIRPNVIRPLGLINGLFGCDPDDWGYIYMEVDDDGNPARFFTKAVECSELRCPEHGCGGKP